MLSGVHPLLVALFAVFPGAILLAAPASAQSRLWEANLLDPADFLPGRQSNTADTSLIRGPATPGFLSFRSEADWRGYLGREERDYGAGKAEVLAVRGTNALWVRPLPGIALAATWIERLDRNRLVVPEALDSRLGAERGTLGLIWMNSLLELYPGMSGRRADGAGRGQGDAFVDFGLRIPDRRRQGYAWMLALGREGLWRAEYGLDQEEVAEDFTVRNLDTAGAGETVTGLYSARAVTHRVLARAPALGGSLSLVAAYGQGRPRRPDREFWYCDSSRRLESRFSYARPFSSGLWRAQGAFEEAEAISIGRRIPEGSEGLKRFHHARNHAVLWDLGGEAGTRAAMEAVPGGPARGKASGAGAGVRAGEKGGGRNWGWRAGATYRRLAWESHPPEDALDSRRETLSYNRLGLSFVANLYGGLYKLSELIDGRIAADLWEVRAAGRLAWGPAVAEPGLSLFRTGFAVRAEGRTVNQRVIVIDTAGSFRSVREGHLAGVTPRLRVSWDLGRARLEGEAARTLPVLVEIRGPGGSDGGDGGADEARYRPFRNGFTARLELVAGF